MKRSGWMCALLALLVFSPANSARAESFPHYDVDAFAWDADTAIVGAEFIETPTPSGDSNATVKISKIYRGDFKIEDQIKVRDWDLYSVFPGRVRVDQKNNGRLGGRGSLLQGGDEVIIFLSQKDSSYQEKRKKVWRILPSGLFLVREGTISLFRQMMNPGNYVEQASEQTRAEWEAQLMAAQKRVEVLTKQLEAEVVVGKSSPWLKLWENRTVVNLAGRYFSDPIAKRLAQNLRASQDFPALETLFLRERGGWQFEDAFKTPAGLAYLRERLKDPLLAPEQREKLALLEKRFAVQEP